MGGWDDRATSMRVVLKTDPDCRLSAAPPPGWFFLYRDANFAGDCIAAQGSTYNNAWRMGIADNSVSSARIGDMTCGLKIADGNVLAGDTTILWRNQSYANLATLGWDDRLSSADTLSVLCRTVP